MGDFYGTGIEIGAGFGPVGITEKKPLVRFWAAFEAVFLSFLGKKEKKINNIVASPLENCIKWS